MRNLSIILLCLSLVLPVMAQETPFPVTLDVAPVVEVTEEAPSGVTINNTIEQPQAPAEPALTEADNEQLFGAVIVGVSVVALGLLIVLSVVLLQYPNFVKTAQDSTPPWMDALIRETLQNIVINPARTVVERTPGKADDELFAKIDERFAYLTNLLLGEQSRTDSASGQTVTVNVGETDGMTAQAERDLTHG